MRFKLLLKRILEIGIINTLRLNFYYYPIKYAFRFPIIASRHLRIRNLKGRIIHNRPKPASIRVGFDYLKIFDNKKSRSIWNVESSSSIIVKDKMLLGSSCKLCIGGGILQVGSNLIVTGNSTIICNKEIEFGDNNLLSWDILIMDTDFHKISRGETVTNSDKKVTLKDNVWIGCRSTILKGTVIPRGAVVAAGSIVSSELESPHCVYGGNPIKVLKSDIHWQP